jgi:hypothetical protein
MEIKGILEEQTCSIISHKISEELGEESGGIFGGFKSIKITIIKHSQSKGSSYIELP